MPENYPPDDHLLRDLHLEIDRRSGALEVRVPVVDTLLDADGAVGAGVLAIAIDVFGGSQAIELAHPDWVLTQQLTIHRIRPLRKGTVHVRGRPLRVGRTQLVAEFELPDEDGAIHTTGSLTFTRIPRRPDTLTMPTDPEAITRFARGSSGFARPFGEYLETSQQDHATVLPMRDALRNSVGALQGGAVLALAEVASRAIATRERAPETPLDLHCHFLALAREGPIVAHGHIVRRTEHEALLRIELRDRGAEDRLCSVVSVHTGALPSDS